MQDSCSDDDTQQWLPDDKRVRAFIERDGGMYDAINRRFGRANGDILAYLNCDEQYLPGALKLVSEFFARHPDIEVLLAGSIVVDQGGKYICHRHSLVPHPQHIWFRFSVLSSSIFIRRSVIDSRKILFDTKWRDVGLHWIRCMMRHKVPMATLTNVTSVFVDTGENMGMKPNALQGLKATGWLHAGRGGYDLFGWRITACAG